MLDDRKLRVLYAIIDSHILTAEPIGSRTISKQYDLGVSSATIRNEMSDLEEQGYLNKPHSSAGRVPSDKAYRLYVDEILRVRHNRPDDQFADKIQNLLNGETLDFDQIVQSSAKILTSLTSYTAIAMSPRSNKERLKHLQISLIDKKEILIVTVNNSGKSKSSVIRLQNEVESEDLNILSNFLNSHFKGLSLEEMRVLIDAGILNEIKVHSKIVDYIMPVVAQSLNEIEDIDIYFEGVNKIFDFPEYKDLDKARNFMNFIENKELLLELLMDNSLKRDIQIFIGDELEYSPVRDCSLISSTYKMGDTTIGKIGIIGPTRMNYIKLIDIMDMFSANITEVINKLI